jgi:hypothetical protein
MNASSWKNAILDVIHRIADKPYQENSWFGIGKQVSSPEELYCELFDDFMYNEFLESDDLSLTYHQRALGMMLRDAMNQYADSTDYLTDPVKVYNDPQWDKIRKLAKKFRDTF